MWVHCVMDFSSSEWLCWSGDPSEAGALGTDTQHRSFLGTPSSGAPTWVPGRRPGPPLLRSGSADRGQGLLVSGLAPRIGGRETPFLAHCCRPGWRPEEGRAPSRRMT